ncbi:uncharacterized protein ACMZJ9_014419 [Mantella aurantiaca]
MEEWEYIEGHKDLYKDKDYSPLTCLKLEGNKALMTERIIHLALEIICLVTGERFPPVKSGDHVTIKVSPPPSLTPEKNKEKKILEVTKKIIGLLTGEVEHLINVKVEVTESEEEVYLRTDVQCKEEKVPTDGPSDGIPPEGCPRRLYSRDPSHEHQEIPQEDQKYGSSNRNPPERCLRPLYSRDPSHEHQEIPQEDQKYGSSNRNPPEKCLRPLYSRDPSHEHQEIPQEEQKYGSINRNPPERCPRPLYSRDPTHEPQEEQKYGSNGHYVMKTGRYLGSSLDPAGQNSDVSPDSPENFLYASDINLGLYIADISPDSGKGNGGSRGERLYRCSECDKSFCQNAALVRHQRNHTGEKPFSCMDCGKSFTRKSILVEHRRIHTGEKPFSCLECGKCFTQRSGLLIHRKTHRGPMKFPCSGCGNFFAPTVNTDTGQIENFCAGCRKFNLLPPISPEPIETEAEEKVIPVQESGNNVLQESKPPSQHKIPMGEKRYTCAECQKSFTRKSILVEHQRIHTGEKPFSCNQCWKSFTQRSGLVIHRRIHAREKIYSCSECSCIFTQKANVFAGEESSCPECRNSSTQKPYPEELLPVIGCPPSWFGRVSGTNISKEMVVKPNFNAPLPTCVPDKEGETPLLKSQSSSDSSTHCSFHFKKANLRDFRCLDNSLPVCAFHGRQSRGAQKEGRGGDLLEEPGSKAAVERTYRKRWCLPGRGAGSGESSNRNPPERCPRPLYSWDSTQEHQEIPQEDLVDRSSNRNPSERCPRPLYSRDSTQEHQEIPQEYQEIPHHDQKEYITVVKMEDADEEEETDVGSDLLCKEEEDPSEINADGRYVENTSQGVDSPGENVSPENHIGLHSPDETLETFPAAGPDLHQKAHAIKRPYSCPQCGKSYTKKSNLVEHISAHNGEKLHPCPECGKFFTQKSYLGQHLKIHTGEKPYSCPQCGKSFTHKTNLAEHKKIHTGERPFSCSECGKCFTRKCYLASHQTMHTGQKPFSCSECGKSYNKRSNLLEHVRSHTGEKLFSCDICGKSFTQRSYLGQHQRIHTGEKPFMCSECGKSFTHKPNLAEHMKTHTGEKPYSCPECGRCFARKSFLDDHRSIHSGEKPFSCTECGKCFRKEPSLIFHQRSHTGEKPFSCADCGKCFTHKSYLVRHQKTHRD